MILNIHYIFLWSILNMLFHVCHQLVCPYGSIVTLIAFVSLFSTVCFQMSPQSACVSGCIITLIAFVSLFSNVHFQMSPQTASTISRKLALIAFMCCFLVDNFAQIFLNWLITFKILFHFYKMAKSAPCYWYFKTEKLFYSKELRQRKWKWNQCPGHDPKLS